MTPEGLEHLAELLAEAAAYATAVAGGSELAEDLGRAEIATRRLADQERAAASDHPCLEWDDEADDVERRTEDHYARCCLGA